MDVKERAELVRVIRVELKQRGQGRRATPAFDTPNFRLESADQFIRRTNLGGDTGPADAAARWDRRANKLRGRGRRGVRNAPHWGDGRNSDYTYDYLGLRHYDRNTGAGLGPQDLRDTQSAHGRKR